LWTPAKADPPLPRPLTPSGAYALIDRENLSSEALKFDTKAEVNTIAIQKGNATHKLFEILPDIKDAILHSVFNVFDDEQFKVFFEGEGQAEVSLAGRLDIKSGSMLVTGQIDRLIISKTLKCLKICKKRPMNT